MLLLFVVPIATHAEISRTTHSVTTVSEESESYRNEVRSASEDATVLQKLDNNVEYVPNELIVQFDDWTPVDTIADSVMALGGELIEFNPDHNIARILIDLKRARRERIGRDVRLPNSEDEATSDAEALTDLVSLAQSWTHVNAADKNYIAKSLATPNDPYYKYQWNLPLIKADKAWDTTSGKDVTIAIIDTGVAYKTYSRYTQAPDLAQTSFAEGYNAIDNNNKPYDNNGHGTHLAGIVAGSTNNGVGVAGIAYSSNIMPVKVLDQNGDGTYANIAEGIYWAVDNGAEIINISLGGNSPSTILEDSVRYAHEHNVLVIAASGNSGLSKLVYPAAYSEYVLSVGAALTDKSRASYSNYGTGLSLLAPGGDTRIDQNKDGNPDGILQQTLKRSGGYVYTNKFSYYFYKGTSVAAPHVSGVAALVKSMGVTDIADIKKILFDTAQDLGTTGYDTATGHGLVNAEAAVLRAVELTTGTTTEEPVVEEPVEPTVEPEEPIIESIVEDTPEPDPEPEEKQPVPPVTKYVIPTVLNSFRLNLDIYNMLGKRDHSFSSWESAYAGIVVHDSKNKLVPGTMLDVEVTDRRGTVILSGAHATNEEGELWIDLGTFAQNMYVITVTAVKDGFREAVTKSYFRFR